MSYGIRGVTVRFGRTVALDDVTVDVPEGEITSLVGGDGAGKTTVLRCLVGRVTPESGTIHRPDRRSIGYMNAGSGTWRELTVDENVEFVGGAYGLSPSELAGRRDELLERAGLAAAHDRLAGNLSGGMRQKLGFVMAVVHRPAFLVLDEPSTGVDPMSRVELWRLISEVAAAGTAVVMATTYLDEAERTATLHVLDRGRLLVAGTSDRIADRMPGSITRDERIEHPDRAWRRGTSIREWHPERVAGGTRIERPDIEDVTIACMLAAREADGA